MCVYTFNLCSLLKVYPCEPTIVVTIRKTILQVELVTVTCNSTGKWLVVNRSSEQDAWLMWTKLCLLQYTPGGDPNLPREKLLLRSIHCRTTREDRLFGNVSKYKIGFVFGVRIQPLLGAENCAALRATRRSDAELPPANGRYTGQRLE